MTAASKTATAMIQGLPLGRQISSGGLLAALALIGPSRWLQWNSAEHAPAVLEQGRTTAFSSAVGLGIRFAPFRIRIPFMANATHPGERHHVAQSVKASEVCETY